MLAGLVNYADWELTEHGGTPAITGDGNSGLPGTRRWVRSNQLKEICPRGNNNIVIIIFLIHDNVYIPC
jgi:hypothetical protein